MLNRTSILWILTSEKKSSNFGFRARKFCFFLWFLALRHPPLYDFFRNNCLIGYIRWWYQISDICKISFVVFLIVESLHKIQSIIKNFLFENKKIGSAPNYCLSRTQMFKIKFRAGNIDWLNNFTRSVPPPSLKKFLNLITRDHVPLFDWYKIEWRNFCLRSSSKMIEFTSFDI